VELALALAVHFQELYRVINASVRVLMARIPILQIINATV